jgi:hypothetical protein
MPVEDLIAKLKHLEAMGSCEACGEVRWEPQAQFLWFQAVPPLFPNEVGEAAQSARPDGEQGFPCLALLCTHCGNVRLHAANLLKNR